MVVVVDLGLLAREITYGGGDAALELVVVVAVQNVVLAVVLIVQDELDRGEALLEQAVLGDALGRAAIGIAAPGDIGTREVGLALPAALVDQRLQPRAIGAGLGAEHAKAG